MLRLEHHSVRALPLLERLGTGGYGLSQHFQVVLDLGQLVADQRPERPLETLLELTQRAHQRLGSGSSPLHQELVQPDDVPVELIRPHILRSYLSPLRASVTSMDLRTDQRDE